MLAIASGAVYLLYLYNQKNGANPDLPRHPREVGPLGARSLIGTAPEREFTRVPNPQRREQPPEVRRRPPAPGYTEPPELTKARLNRLYEAMPDGPLGWSRGKINKDKDLLANRVPHHHPGLSKVGIAHTPEGRGAPTF